MSSASKLRLLLDSHIFLWMTTDRLKVSGAILKQLDDPENEVIFSAVSSWEIAIKRAKGRLHFSGSPAAVAEKIGLPILPITAEHCELAGELPLVHSDPFDRLLIAQAKVEGCAIVTRDAIIARYQVPVLRA